MKKPWLIVLVVHLFHGYLAVAVADPKVPSTVDPAPYRLESGIAEYVRQAKSGYETIKNVDEALKQIEKGEKPTLGKMGDPQLQELADRFKTAAKKVKEQPLVTDFDPRKYSVTPQELAIPQQRPKALARLREYVTALESAKAVGDRNVASLRSDLKVLDQGDQNLGRIIKIYPKLQNSGTFGEVFTWNWLTLDQEVRPSLRELRGEVRNHLKKLEAETRKVAVQVDNLKANIAILEKPPVSLDGSWVGTATVDGEKMKLTASIKEDAKVVGGSITIDDSTTAMQGFSFNPKSRELAFKAGSGKDIVTFTGMLSQDGKSMTGTMTEGGDKAPFELKRQ